MPEATVECSTKKSGERGVGLIQTKKKNCAAALLLLLFMMGIYGCGSAKQSMEKTGTETEDAAVETKGMTYPAELASVSPDMVLTVYSEGIFLVFNGESYGFLAETGEWISDLVYELAYPFSQGLSCVRREGKYGFINGKGEIEIPFIYDRANSFSEGLAYFETAGRYGFLNREGREVFLLDCDSISSFQEGLAYFSVDGKYGYIDKNGEEAIPPLYDDADYFKDGIARVRKGIYFGVIDTGGREVIGTEYDSVSVDGRFITVQIGNKYGCFDRSGTAVLPVMYDYIRVEEDRIVYREDDSHEAVAMFPELNAVITAEENRFGITDCAGNMIVPPVYEDIYCLGVVPDLIFVVSDNGKYGFFHADELSEEKCGEIPLCYEEVRDYREDMAVVGQDGKYGVVDREGTPVFDFVYEGVRLFESGMLSLENDGTYRLADGSGRFLGNREYDNIAEYGDGCRIEADGVYGFLNREGEEVIPPSYDFVSSNEVYQTFNCFIAKNWKEMNWCIVLTGKPQSSDLSAMILSNEITPKIGRFHELIESGELTVKDMESSHSAVLEGLRNENLSMRLFRVEGSGSPVMYVCAAPYMITNFPFSQSAFFSVENGQLRQPVSGCQSGGSVGGDFVHLWFDREDETVKIGVSGEYEGSEGYSSGHKIYRYGEGGFETEYYFDAVTQKTENFLTEALLENPEMFFDGAGSPYSKETILEAEYASEYRINGERTTRGAYYELLMRYRF